ncbi:MAG: FAD-dependent oxidoreductase [Pseudomonadota bacterium]
MSLIGREITIVGAGIAGLAAAQALAMRGAAVTVLERAPEIAEVGAGLQISPNGARVLDALGLTSDLEAATTASQAVTLRNHRGRRVLRMSLSRHARFSLTHRADLIALLEAGARRAGVAIETGVEVATVDPGDGRATLRLSDGTARRTSLAIGADGLHSRARAALLGETNPTFTGHVAWRALIPAPRGIPDEAQVFMGPSAHVVAYPLRHGALLNLVCVEERTGWLAEGWHHAGGADALRAAFAQFGEPVRSWLAMIEQPMVWGLFRHPVAPTWHGPSVALIGDAAHPTLPFLAQGACLALEDAWALAHALASHDGDAAALAAYQATRRPRAKAIVDAATANARNYHLRPPLQPLAHAILRAIDAAAPQAMLARYDWIYRHDPTAVY